MAAKRSFTSKTVTIDDAPQPPQKLRLTLRKKTMWESFMEKCKGMSPQALIDFFNSEKARTLEAVKKRGKITEEGADFLNKATKDNVEKILDQFKESFLEQMKITPNDTPEEIELKLALWIKLLSGLKNCLAGLKRK